ncbi:MAG TPA: hypothetical protein PLQ13_03030 [Candidatus Krumholzibacteria bacterium]|nr:hypothetical protein [Candidatus Krumholzibacteria bacterium]
MNARRILMLLALAVLVVPAGCIFSPDNSNTNNTGPDGLPFPNTPEKLMANFQTVYESMDIDGYREVIDPNFAIYLSQETINEFALPRDFFDYDEEVLITERMFSGNAITRPNGDIVPGITRIDFSYFQPEAAWAVSPADHRIPNALWAPYRVDITITQGTEGRLNIKGIIEFYLTSEQVEYQGRTQTKYKMIGQVDYTSSAQP